VVVKSTNNTASPSDYTINPSFVGDSAVLTIPKGSTVSNITFTPIDDSNIEVLENLLLIITNVCFGAQIGMPSSCLISIEDNDKLNRVNQTQIAEIQFYLNPASSDLEFKQVIKHIKLFDMNGKIVIAAENTSKLNITNIPAGIYQVRMNKTTTAKVVVQH